MKPYIVKNKEFIQFFNNLCPKRQQKLIPVLSRDQINCFSEICKNFLRGNLSQNKDIIKKLKHARHDIKSIALKKSPLYKKKKILQSRRGGAILSILLPLAASVITSLLTSKKS